MAGLQGLLSAYGDPEATPAAEPAAVGPLAGLAAYGTPDPEPEAEKEPKVVAEAVTKKSEPVQVAQEPVIVPDDGPAASHAPETMDEAVASTRSAHGLRMRGLAKMVLRNPPDPASSSDALKKKILGIQKLRARGKTVNSNLQRSKAFRNPNILEKVVAFCGIDEAATNCPPSQFDPKRHPESFFHDAIAEVLHAAEEQRRRRAPV